LELGALGEADLVNGPNFTVQSTVVRSGSYALRVTGAGQDSFFRFRSRAAGGTQRGLYLSCRFYLRVAALPVGQNVWVCRAGAIGTRNARLRLNTDGTLSVTSWLSPTDTVRATSTNTLSADGLWHRIDFDCAWSSGAGMRVFVDGVQWASDATDTVTADTAGFVGASCPTPASLTAVDLYLDDVVWYDSSLPAILADYNVGLLLPSSDSAVGGWTRPDGTTTTGLSTEVDNVPPTGNTSTTNTTGGHDKNIVSSATDNYDAVCAAYSTVVSVGGTVLAVQAICNDAQAITTSSPKAGAVVITANPSGQTENSFDFGLPNGTAGSTSAAAMGTFPTGWGTHVGPVTETPTLTMSSGPTVRVGKRVATTREVDVDFLGVYVMWNFVAQANPMPKQAVQRATMR